MDDPSTSAYGWSGLKYFLYEYEEHLARGGVVRLPWDKLESIDLQKSIEHILPQTPTDRYWKDRFDAKQRAQVTADIGNLCLTFDNDHYGNKPFPGKRGADGSQAHLRRLKPLHGASALAAFKDWDEAALLQRHKEIVGNWALQRWHVEETEDAEEFDQDAEEVDEE